MKAAWQAIEFGRDEEAGESIRKSLTSSDPDIKQVADRLNTVVQTRIVKLVAEAKKTADDGHKYNAYEQFEQISERYHDYELPADVKTAQKELSIDPAVKAALAAKKNLESARGLIDSGNVASRKKAAIMLKKIATEMASNNLGKEAQSLLSKINAP
jgi:hypothetical protein